MRKNSKISSKICHPKLFLASNYPWLKFSSGSCHSLAAIESKTVAAIKSQLVTCTCTCIIRRLVGLRPVLRFQRVHLCHFLQSIAYSGWVLVQVHINSHSTTYLKSVLRWRMVQNESQLFGIQFKNTAWNLSKLIFTCSMFHLASKLSIKCMLFNILPLQSSFLTFWQQLSTVTAAILNVIPWTMEASLWQRSWTDHSNFFGGVFLIHQTLADMTLARLILAVQARHL